MPVRFLSIHEHFSMDLLRKYDVPVPKGGVAYTPQEAEETAKKLGSFFFFQKKKKRFITNPPFFQKFLNILLFLQELKT